jgi:hypothetical protein
MRSCPGAHAPPRATRCSRIMVGFKKFGWRRSFCSWLFIAMLPACAHERANGRDPVNAPPTAGVGDAPPAMPTAPPLPPPPAARPSTDAATESQPDEWQSACAAVSGCGACLNHGPCRWCAAEQRCVGPRTPCEGKRVEQSGECGTAPLEVAKLRYPRLAGQLARYEVEREVKDAELTGDTQESFFLNSGDCFAVLAEPLPGNDSELWLGYGLRIRGTPLPADRVAPAEPGTGGRDGRAELSPEFCPWEHQPLAVWNARPKSTRGGVRLRLLRRSHPDPARLARERPASPAAPSRGGSCSSMECGEDCRSELSACELDCFRHGSHEPTMAQICKSTCRQLARACERGCSVPCP